MATEKPFPQPKPILERITDLLKSSGISFRIIEHEPIDGTASNSSLVSHTSPEQGAKTLLMMSENKTPVMVVLRGTDKADFKAIKTFIGSKNLRMATLDEIQTISPAEVGTLPPFGGLLGIATYTDCRLLKEEKIVLGTGSHTLSIVIDAKDYLRVAQPVVGDFAKE